MVGRPPFLGRKPRATIAERFDGRGEQQRLGDGHGLGLVTLLAALRPKSREIRRDEDTGDDVAIGGLELGDLRREVVGEWREQPRVDNLVAGLDEPRRQPVLGVGERHSVRVVDHPAPTTLLVSMEFHRPVKVCTDST